MQRWRENYLSNFHQIRQKLLIFMAKKLNKIGFHFYKTAQTI